jgi:hypothetical protein
MAIKLGAAVQSKRTVPPWVTYAEKMRGCALKTEIAKRSATSSNRQAFDLA